jgi:hypothetical protein
MIATERERMKRAVEQEGSLSHSSSMVTLKQALSEVHMQLSKAEMLGHIALHKYSYLQTRIKSHILWKEN